MHVDMGWGRLGMWAAVLAVNIGFATAIQFTCPPGSTKGTPGWPCIRDDFGKPLALRVVFMEEPGATTNPTAVAKAAALGRLYSCEDPELAVPECFVAENWNTGWVGAYAQKIIQDLGLPIIAMTAANYSDEVKATYQGTSGFTRCVWDVKLGQKDWCVGDFWETPERRNLTAFTAAMDSDLFNLFTRSVPNPANEFNINSLLIIFQPFENSVWLCMGFVFFFCAFAIWITETPHNEDDMGKGAHGLLKACYFSTMGFVGGDLPATVWPSRIISIGFMIFIFIHVTSYTASLATTLVTNQVPHGEIASLQDLVMKGKRLCVYQAMAKATSRIIGSDVQMVEMDSYGPMLEKLHQGNCSAAVVGKLESIEYMTASNANFTVCTDPGDPNNFATCSNSSILPTPFYLNPASCGKQCGFVNRFCNFVQLDDPTISQISLGFAMPVRKDIERWVSAAVIYLRMQGYGRQTQQEQVYSKNPAICQPPPRPTGSMTIQQMSGTYFFGGIFILLGMIIHAFELLFWGEREALPLAQPKPTKAPSEVLLPGDAPETPTTPGRRSSARIRHSVSTAPNRKRLSSATALVGLQGEVLLRGLGGASLVDRRRQVEEALERMLGAVRKLGEPAAGKDGDGAAPTAAWVAPPA